MRKSFVILFVLFSIGLLTCGGGSSSTEDPDNRKSENTFIFGIHTQSWDQDVERTLHESGEIGATHSTMSFVWQEIEPSPGHFTWDKYDEIINWGHEYNIKIIPQLQYSRDKDCMPPDPTDYASYAAAVVGRYCDAPGFGRIVQIWNEPNIPHFWCGTPEQYAGILDAAYRAIKLACPEATVVGFNLAPGPEFDVWLKRALGSSPGFDWFGWHSYGSLPFQSDPGNHWAGETAVPAIRALLDEQGLEDKPMFDSERGLELRLGLEPLGSFVPETYIALLAIADQADVRGLTWYTYHFNAFEDGDLGLVGLGQSWSRRPAYCTYKTMMTLLPKYKYDGQLSGSFDSSELQVHLFRDEQLGALLAFFAPLVSLQCDYRVKAPQHVRVTVGPAASVTLTDWVGHDRILAPDDRGLVGFDVTSRISYLEIPLPAGSDFSPQVDITLTGDEQLVPIPLESEIVALVSTARGYDSTDPTNAAERCLGISTWHYWLTCCLGQDVVFPVIDPPQVQDILSRCWLARDNPDPRLFADIDRTFRDLEGIVGQEACRISQFFSQEEQDEFLGKTPPSSPGPFCDDYSEGADGTAPHRAIGRLIPQ